MFHAPEKFRLKEAGPWSSDASFGNNGAFVIRSSKLKQPLRVIASDGEGWEHVSVSLANRTPTWEEMCLVKRLFWDPEDCVIQFHPPASDYVNLHPHCLHLWRPVGTPIALPPSLLVGMK